MMIELSSKISYTMTLKIEIVHVDIQTLTVVDIKLLLGVLKQEGGLSNAPGTLDANQSVTPVNLVHKGSTNWCIGMFHEISVCPEKRFHLPRFVLKRVQRYYFFLKLQS